MVHLRCGADIFPALVAAGLHGPRLNWSDPLCQGPLGPVAERDQWRPVRARYLEVCYGLAREEQLAALEKADRALVEALAHGEIVLWFEHDLFDQAILAYLLAWFAAQPARPTLSLVTLDRHPAHDRFIGLGQLTAGELADLFAARVPVTAAMLEAGAAAWAAFVAADRGDRTALEQLADAGPPALPFLADAARRWLADRPGMGVLPRTARHAIDAITAGADTPELAFEYVQAQEAAPFLGDTMFYGILHDLAVARPPRVLIDGVWPRGTAPKRGVKLRLPKVR